MAAFVDTNILIYAFADNSSSAVSKVAIARRLLTSLLERQELIISAQVLSEFASNAMRKAKPPLSLASISERIHEMREAPVVPIDASLVQLALIGVQPVALATGTPLLSKPPSVPAQPSSTQRT